MLNDFINLIFPRWCAGCNGVLIAGEEWVCAGCLSELNISTTYREKPNDISTKFYGKIHVEHACTMFYFNRGGVIQNLLHQLKYSGYYDLGKWLGTLFGSEIRNENWVKEIHLIVPIPLHKKKLTIRGYNQSESFASGISEALDIPAREVMRRTKHTSTQTRKSRVDRWKNVSGIFELKDIEEVLGKNILLIDDVITSGATLEEAGRTLKEGGAGKLFIATIASA